MTTHVPTMHNVVSRYGMVRVWDRGPHKLYRYRVDTWRDQKWQTYRLRNGEHALYEHLDSAQTLARRLEKKIDGGD